MLKYSKEEQQIKDLPQKDKKKTGETDQNMDPGSILQHISSLDNL